MQITNSTSGIQNLEFFVNFINHPNLQTTKKNPSKKTEYKDKLKKKDISQLVLGERMNDRNRSDSVEHDLQSFIGHVIEWLDVVSHQLTQLLKIRRA